LYRVVPRKNKDKYNAFVLLETDRQRIAKDLHDTSLQNLTAIVHKVELASMYINQDPIRAKMELSVISNSLKDTINEIRDTIFELRPMSFDDLGFRDLLASYIESLPEIGLFQGILLWAIMITSYFLFRKEKVVVCFKSPEGLSEDELKTVFADMKKQMHEDPIMQAMLKAREAELKYKAQQELENTEANNTTSSDTTKV
jgi:signal transduction histidine kinase